jgi:hypothetical protein
MRVIILLAVAVAAAAAVGAGRRGERYAYGRWRDADPPLPRAIIVIDGP